HQRASDTSRFTWKNLAVWARRTLILKASARQELHHRKRSAFPRADVGDFDDMRVRQLHKRANLASKPAGELGIVHHRRARDLDDDLGLDVLIERPVDEPHSTFTELGGDEVAPARKGHAFPAVGSDRHGTVLTMTSTAIKP